jgi:hypothetical protein
VNLGLQQLGCQLVWVEMPGMRWENVVPLIHSLIYYRGIPFAVIVHCGLFHTVAPLCNSFRNDVASMETCSSWMNCSKEKCVSADLMHFMYAMNIQNDVIGFMLRENCKSKQVIDFIA